MTPVVVVLVALLGTWAMSLLALRLPGPIARPVADRWHEKSTPLTGGLAMLVGFLVAIAAAVLAGHHDRRFAYIAVAATAAFLLGLSDDERRIGPRTKFAGQITIAAAAASVFHPGWLPTVEAVPLAVVVLVAAMNSFNFLDNIDGLAAGTAAIAAGMLALTIFVSGGPRPQGLLACAVAGAALGFLPLNYRGRRPAALFMGDSGSLFLGLTVGVSALVTTPTGVEDVSAAVIAPLLILALPILDTSLVIIVRLLEGRPIWQGGRDHLSHRLVYIGLSEREAVGALLALAAACASIAVAIAATHNALITGASVGLTAALLIGFSSRLALVSGNGVVSAKAFAVDNSDAVPDAPIAREPELSEDLQGTVVELSGEPTLAVVQDHARAN